MGSWRETEKEREGDIYKESSEELRYRDVQEHREKEHQNEKKKNEG